jgi:hypothetical protein
MKTTIHWPRFFLVSILSAVVMLMLYGLWTGTVVASMNLSPGLPSRPPEEVKPLVPFLAVVSITQLVVFAFLYLRIYPQRSLANALWWGLWGGFFMVLPDGQFFVITPNQTWALLFMQWAEGIVTTMLFMAAFQLIYRPKDEGWTQLVVEWQRFLLWGTASAVLVFALDIPFHQLLAPKIFTEYPAHDYPHRPPVEVADLMWFMALTYLFQLNFFCYTFLRVYPMRGIGNAIWYGAWLGVWVVIPNMQFFVGLDRYTWHMLAIQVPEGAILTMIMMAFFEFAYHPKPRGALAAAHG